MAHPTTYVPKSAFAKWFESRLPLIGLLGVPGGMEVTARAPRESFD